MKFLIILGDGMADEPVGSLQNKTPLQVANKPMIDQLAKEGVCGRLVTVPEGFHPGSEIANLGVLGYDVSKVYEGRGSLEAASMGIPVEDDEIALRCNLICIEGGWLKNHSAGHISTEEARELIEYLQEKLGGDTVSFYPGVSYRHLLKIKGGSKAVKCTPPHDILGKISLKYMPVPESDEGAETSDLIYDLILGSQGLLMDHPINIKRIAEGKDPANSIWPWSPGHRPSMEPLSKIFDIRTGAVISAVDLIHGIGVYAGLDKVTVEGATGLYDTNYEGKVDATLRELKEKDFVFLHIEASDEAGHEGDADLKIKTIENLDQRVVKPIIEAITQWDEPVVVAILPDHPTPVHLRTHTAEPVPFLIWRNGIQPDAVECYDEESVVHGELGLLKGAEFIKRFFSYGNEPKISL
ncbi:MAG: cofactor-independent phosphoglycerate mutase [Bacteroidales bacterium]